MGSSPGQVMGVRGINDTRAEKAHDHLAIRSHGKPANSTTYTAGYSFQGMWSSPLWTQTPMRGFNYVL